MFPENKRLGVVFDLDGTLVNSMPLVLAAFRYALERFRAVPTNEEILNQLGGPVENSLRNLLEEKEHALPEAMERLVDYSARYDSDIVPFEGAVELLDMLLKSRTQVALWTGRDRQTTSDILTRHNLWKYFQSIVCGDDFQSHKPDPEGLAYILEEWSANNSDVIFVGDSDMDVLAGYAIDVETLLITNGRKVSDHIKRLTREWVETPAQAYEIINARVFVQQNHVPLGPNRLE